MDFVSLGMTLLLILGFGFVIFWHELGHFLAAKWAGVKVEQFAVGFGQALVSWRKGLGFRRGSSHKEYEARLHAYLKQRETSDRQVDEKIEYGTAQLDYAAAELGISPTEYRLNWIPLGGYVKMLGQDDLDPNAQSDSPNAYNNKPIRKRMVIVSAGVVMNIILAIILFTVLFGIGFNVPPPVVGSAMPGSPAQQGGLQVGDRVITFDGRYQGDFTKISMNVALAEEGEPVKLLVKRPGVDKPIELSVVPRRSEYDPSGFLQMGILPSPQLQGVDPDKLSVLTEKDKATLMKEAVKPGETIIAVNGQPVEVNEFYKLDRALQAGLPVTLTVRDANGKTEDRIAQPRLISPFSNQQLNFAGMVPRTVAVEIEPWSTAKDKLQPDDVIVELTVQPANDSIPNPTRQKLMEVLDNAGRNGAKVDLTVLRGNELVSIKGLTSVRLKEQGGRMGLGIQLSPDEDHAVVADVQPKSAAEAAGIPAGAEIRSIGGTKIQTWREVQRILAAATADQPLKVSFIPPNGDKKERETTLTLNSDQIAAARQHRYYANNVTLKELYEPRQTGNPITAAEWGLGETRDLTLQFYITLRRMFQGSVPVSNAMGPLGIFHTGSRIAQRGKDWLIWFLAMISANLAVVNFLPIPIVDGGLFVFLILEKIMGKPLSPRAQSIAQIVGLALIVGVFLFVTYHDIYRMVY
jgi:regulator of sigma E protease